MKISFVRRLSLVYALSAVACGGGPASPGDAGPESPDAGPADPSDLVFDHTVLHEIRIEVAPEDVDALEDDHDNRVPCTITYDGVTLSNAGIRQKGHGTSSGSLYTKPSFSIKFDEFQDQELHGLDKLILQNARADETLLHEDLGYLLHRRAGIPAPRTGHAVVTMVGLPGETERVYGVHVVVEAVNEDFLERAYGPENDEGNLYEDEAIGDFAVTAATIDLKDELEDGRTREHLFEVADILQNASDDELLDQLEPHFDLDRALRSFALDMITRNDDGFWLAAHNYYLYDNPLDGRFVLLPHGLDLLLSGAGCGGIWSATLLGRRLLGIGMESRVREEIYALLAGAYDVEVLNARVDELEALLTASSRRESAFLGDVDRFHESKGWLKTTLTDIPEIWLPEATCGDGVAQCPEACDDGNLVDGDGCTTSCTPEYCGDGVIQEGLGETCDGQPGCACDCATYVVCGNGEVECPEPCDDGNPVDGDGCTTSCLPEYCGDGVIQEGLGETCDGEPDCRIDCSGFIVCGDGVVDSTEYCDDGNTSDSDGCSSDCVPECTSAAHDGTTFTFCAGDYDYADGWTVCGYFLSSPAAPLDADEDAWLYEQSQLISPGRWWLGMNQWPASTEWWLADSVPATFFNWGPSQPDDTSAGDRCVVFDPAMSGDWNDVACDSGPHDLICRDD